ncbi:hypothetical protein FNV43_RR04190 [Rhamnella rubrinervis]|uniref:BSD domain-containing protein n=1 Tax=Rhamnella rubrinervis TaxID=2594499 RepID=A0A8K0HLD4_9ROSA|nr:hypothetical protein FNV43_RR04190 [Rhamnella rubrinervis]
MSWFFNSIQSDDPHDSSQPPPPSDVTNSGVQDDLSAITQTIGRQLRGFASFIAPPPSPQSAGDASKQMEKQSPSLLGIRNDLAEIGGNFKSSLSLLSSNSNRAVAEISKFASNLLSYQDEAQAEEEDNDDDDDGGDDDDDDRDDGAPGITDEILHFITEISLRPECWTDFPLSLDHGFSMSTAMREHASTVELLIPEFAALRQRLCNSMNEEVFWMVYFILLVPRLHGHDSELLSNPKILEARDQLLQKLQNKRNTEVEETTENSGLWNESEEGGGNKVSETQGEDNPSIEKEVSTETVNAKEERDILDEASFKQWSDMDKTNIDSGSSMDAKRKIESEEDISFSDLEDDDHDHSRRSSDVRREVDNSSPTDWVKLGGSSEIQIGQKKTGLSKDRDSEGESSDWLNVDDYD